MSLEKNNGSADLKKRLISAGRKSVEELIKVAEEPIIEDVVEDGLSAEEKSKVQALAADRLKNAAAAKKLALFDAFDILSRIDEEESIMNHDNSKDSGSGGFAERRAR